MTYSSRPLLLAGLILASAATQVFAQVATIGSVTGNPTALRTPGVPPAQIRDGATFDFGAVFQTDSDDALQLSLVTGQRLTLAPGSSIRIDRGPNGPVIALLAGSVNVISDPSANGGRVLPIQIAVGSSSVTIPTTMAVEFVVAADTAGGQSGAVVVSRGEARLATPGGSIERIFANQSARWEPQAAPRLVPAASLPAALQARIAAAQSAVIQFALTALPATAAGNANPQPADTQNQQANIVAQSTPAIASPGGGGGCVGSGC